MEVEALAKTSGPNGFFAQEVMRFYSLAGTLIGAKQFTLDKECSVDERQITHVLLRSLLENYFTILYLFDDPNKTSARYELLKNDFKVKYRKLKADLDEEPWRTLMQAHPAQLEPAHLTWRNLKSLPDVNSMLTELKNDRGEKLNFLYVAYRVSSFDIHGRSLEAIFGDVFGKQCNLPVLDVAILFGYMACEYLDVLQTLNSQDAT